MAAPSLNFRSAADLVRGIAGGKISAHALMQSCLERIDEREDAVKAWAFVDQELAKRQVGHGANQGLLSGLPIGIKDVLDTYDMPTQMGSPIYDGYRPLFDAAVVAMARRAGALVLGKTVTAEFAGLYPGVTANPHDHTRTPGGSSSGSAAAVADGMVPLAVGTQTGGSIIRPASYCGVVGFKPSFGILPRSGLKIACDSLDTIGFLGRTVEDVALGLAALSGNTSFSMPVMDRKLHVGVLRDGHWAQCLPETDAAIEAAVRALGRKNVSVVDMRMPTELGALRAARAVIGDFERSRALAAEWATSPRLFSDLMARTMERGFRISPDIYDQALHQATDARRVASAMFEAYDVLLCPAAAGEAPVGLSDTGDPGHQSLWTLLHMPAICLPTHSGPSAMPVGIQLVAPQYKDSLLLAAADTIHHLL